MQQHHDNNKHTTDLLVRRTDDRPEVPNQEKSRKREASPDKKQIQQVDRAPADERDGYPDQVRIPVQRPALEHVSRLAGAEPAEDRPERDGDDKGIPINQPRGAGQKSKIVRRACASVLSHVLAYVAREKQYENDGCRDPERAVQVCVAVEDVEEGFSWEECCEAPV